MWFIQHKALYSAPVHLSHNQRILDIGCGTGTWAKAIATENPDCIVLGIDITLPQRKVLPSNCSFVMADAESHWLFASNPFNLIHGRMLVNSIRDWSGFINRCKEHLVPGGWLELNEVVLHFFAEDGCDESDAPMIRWWNNVFRESARNNGIDVESTSKHAQQMRDAGFLDVREKVFKWRVGIGWARTQDEKEIGELQLRNMQELVGSITTRAVQHGNLGEIDAKQAQTLAAEAKLDVVENADKHGYYMQFATFVGRKAS